MSSMYEDLSVDDYKTRFKDANEAHLLLDVRTVEEFEEARIPGAVNIPLDELYDNLDEIEEMAGDTPIVLVCRSGSRSAMGAQSLHAAGVEASMFNLETGTLGWAKKKLPLESGPTE